MYKYEKLLINFRYHKANAFTECNIVIPNAMANRMPTTMVAVGIARLKPGDTPNQHEAQKVSLGRALKNAGFSQEYRKKVVAWWEGEYQKRHKDTDTKAARKSLQQCTYTVKKLREPEDVTIDDFVPIVRRETHDLAVDITLPDGSTQTVLWFGLVKGKLSLCLMNYISSQYFNRSSCHLADDGIDIVEFT